MTRLVLIMLVLAIVALSIFALRHRHRNQRLDRVRMSDFDVGEWRLGAILFSTPFCLPCQLWEEELAVGTLPWVKIDIGSEPKLVTRYGVHTAPELLVVDRGGRVLRQYDTGPTPTLLAELRDLASRVASSPHSC